MAIITAGDLSGLYQIPFRANGSTVSLKKISETDWLLFGDIAEGDSEGFGDGSLVFSNPWFMVYSDQLGPGVLFDGDDGIDGIELSTQPDTTRSVFFRPQDGIGLPPDPDQWFLRFDLRDDNGDYPGNTMVVRYGNGTEETSQLISSKLFTEVVSNGGLVEIEIELDPSGIPITGTLHRLSWSYPF